MGKSVFSHLNLISSQPINPPKKLFLLTKKNKNIFPPDDTLYETLLRDETEKPTIRTALSEIGIDFPPDASNEAVVDSALQVINAQTEQLEAANIDAAASFEQWDDVAAWKKTGTGERVFKGGEEEVVNELVGVGVQAAQAQAAQAQAAQEVKAEA